MVSPKISLHSPFNVSERFTGHQQLLLITSFHIEFLETQCYDVKESQPTPQLRGKFVRTICTLTYRWDCILS